MKNQKKTALHSAEMLIKHNKAAYRAIYSEVPKKASREKVRMVMEELKAMKLKEAAKKIEDSIEETLTYCDFPSEHWSKIHTNNVIERLNREVRRRTRVVGTFPDGNSALMLFAPGCGMWPVLNGATRNT